MKETRERENEGKEKGRAIDTESEGARESQRESARGRETGSEHSRVGSSLSYGWKSSRKWRDRAQCGGGAKGQGTAWGRGQGTGHSVGEGPRNRIQYGGGAKGQGTAWGRGQGTGHSAGAEPQDVGDPACAGSQLASAAANITPQTVPS